jgi:hypothetical protein
MSYEIDYAALGLPGGRAAIAGYVTDETIGRDILNRAAMAKFAESTVDNWINNDPCGDEEGYGTYGWDPSILTRPDVKPSDIGLPCRNNGEAPMPTLLEVLRTKPSEPALEPQRTYPPCGPDMFFRMESGATWDIADLGGLMSEKSFLPPLCLSCGDDKQYGFSVSQYEIKRPSTREVTIPRPFGQGEWDTSFYHGPAIIDLTIEAYSQSPTGPHVPPWAPQNPSVSELRDAIYKFLTPMNRNRLVFRESGDYIQKTAVFRMENVACRITNKWHATIDLSLRIPSGRIQSYAVRKIHLTPPAILEHFPIGIHRGVIMNNGFSPADWRLEVFGGFTEILFKVWSPDWGYKNPVSPDNKHITDPWFNLEACNYRVFRLVSDVAPSERVVIMSHNRSVVAIDGQYGSPTYGQPRRNLYSKVDPASRWFTIEPGQFYIEYHVALRQAPSLQTLKDFEGLGDDDFQNPKASPLFYPQMAAWTNEFGSVDDPLNPFDYAARWRGEVIGGDDEIQSNIPYPPHGVEGGIDLTDYRYPVWTTDHGLAGSAFMSWRDTW